jgi:AraC-like DNA-binding protein
MRGSQSQDFASAAMVRLLARGMHALGMKLPATFDQLHEATVPLDLKRHVVQAALEQGGIVCLPLLGRGLHELAMEPTQLALTAGRNASALWVRWQRLERYIHSRHRIQVMDSSEIDAKVMHKHKDHGPPPMPFEDLVVCGVLCALLEANGLQSVRAYAAGAELYPNPVAEALENCIRKGETGTWNFTWEKPAQPSSGLDISVSWGQVTPTSWSQLAGKIGEMIAQQLPYLLSLDQAAASLGLARRSFQRALSAEGLSYTQLLAEVRFRLAGWYLLHGDISIAEVGFVCGYADQAHLTREFNRRVGLPPARYRDLFSMV